ncbi:TIGR04255 family protein [uncultured Rhodoblastus sp.]|uniref:TIGR04255 family protein n=1 Tax=uncultured Rhodoblastus sp. TaxID=543037 RepID=UPI0025D5504C|nr:TIGR04255 family protein [uncultured Rhodoblastus sp.]
MHESLTRPEHLPDYRDPPLNEVVIGVQFVPARGYQQIRAGEVWGLYRADFPLVEEQPPIPPSFETFGLSPAGPMINFGFVTGAQHDRFWFLTPSKDELIQFQHDRLLHNWRKVGDQSNQYPRFENMIVKFDDELQRLETYFSGLSVQSLNCNQAEISYINHINIDKSESSAVKDWFRVLNLGDWPIDDVSATWRRTLRSDHEGPYGRLSCELASAIDPRGRRIFVLTLTVRGRPSGSSIVASIDFLKRGRAVIVEEFTAITSDSAHKIWGRLI